MDINDLNDIEYMLNLCGYKINKKNSNGSAGKDNLEPVLDFSEGANTNCCVNLDLDIPGGFQDIDPIVFILIGEVIGNALSGILPFNVALTISNWLNLVGQAIETYGAQQQYFQNGPGRLYNLAFKNVGNPMCSCQSTSKSNATNLDTSTQNATTESTESITDEINILKGEMEEINKKIEELMIKIEKT